MTTKESDNLRKRAEAKLGFENDDISGMSEDGIRKTVYELRTHQIELEMQNEELRLAQEELEQSRRRFSDLYDFAPVGYLTVSEKGLIIEANLTTADMMGVTRGTLLKQALSAFILDEDQDIHYTCRKKLLDTGQPQTCICRLRKKDGGLFDAQLKYIIVSDVDGNSGQFRAVITDVTERHLLEAEQLKTQKLEAIGTLAGGIAHDFNNLLQGVFGYVSLAKMASTRPEKVVEMLEQVEKALSLSVNLTTQLLTFAKGGNPVKKRIDLTAVIQNATKFALSGSCCDCRFYLAPDLWHTEVDEGQIAQVIQNIVLNASEAMPQGGVIDILSENINLPKVGRQIRISIKDNGAGIPKSYRSKIFDPYFTTKKKGSGLGLATSYSVVRKHGGSIDVKSSQNKGTTLFITLPACEPEILKEKPPEAPLYKYRHDQKLRILLMDDEVMVRDVAHDMIEKLGHDIELACHGEEAIGKYQGALVSGNLFDLVILDLTIKGGMGGQETIQKLHEIDPKVQAVVSSGYSDNPIISEYLKYGFKGRLNKPYNIRELKECLNEFIMG